jgi:hypothetical protein
MPMGMMALSSVAGSQGSLRPKAGATVTGPLDENRIV